MSKKSVGRQVSGSLEYFNKLCEYIEFETELQSLPELHEKIEEIAGGENEGKVYSTKYLKQKLKEKYGENIYFSEVDAMVKPM